MLLVLFYKLVLQPAALYLDSGLCFESDFAAIAAAMNKQIKEDGDMVKT